MGLKTGGWRRRWIIRLGRLNSSIIENLFETSIETNTVENAIPFDRFYPLLSTRYNLTVHRGISSYNHDRVRSVSLKWKIVRNGWLIATGFNGVEFTMLPVWGSCWKQTCRRQVMNQVFNSTLSIKKELFTIFISRISLKFTKTEFLKKFRIPPFFFIIQTTPPFSRTTQMQSISKKLWKILEKMVVYFNPTADDLHLHPIPNIVLRTSHPNHDSRHSTNFPQNTNKNFKFHSRATPPFTLADLHRSGKPGSRFHNPSTTM